jgi:hypothetical protein
MGSIRGEKSSCTGRLSVDLPAITFKSLSFGVIDDTTFPTFRDLKTTIVTGYGKYYAGSIPIIHPLVNNNFQKIAAIKNCGILSLI